MKCVKNIRTVNGFSWQGDVERCKIVLRGRERKEPWRKNVLICNLERLKERFQIHLGIGE